MKLIVSAFIVINFIYEFILTNSIMMNDINKGGLPQLNNEDLKIKIPSGILISGSTGSGKTTLLLRLLRFNQELFSPPPKSILYCYGQFGSHILEMQSLGVEYCEGIPTEEKLEGMQKPLLLIFDDLMGSVSEKYITDIYTKKSHHQN